MHTQRQLLRLSSSANFLFPSLPPPPSMPMPSHHLHFPGRPTTPHYCSLCSAHRAWLAQISEQLTAAATPEMGPIELPSSISSLISASSSSDLSSLQSAASFLITGAFSLFLFRTLRRRAKRARQRKLRSSAMALEGLQNVKVKGKKAPSVEETLFGALIAAAFGFLLYKFTTSVEYTLNNQPLSSNYSVRQITITIRTIINGMCYLATFVFGFNSLGLFLYSGQLAMNSFVDVRVSEDKAQSSSSYTKNVDRPEDENPDNKVQK